MIDRCGTSDCLSGPVQNLATLDGNITDQIKSATFRTTTDLRFLRIRFSAIGNASTQSNARRRGFEAKWSIDPLLVQGVDRSVSQVITLAVVSNERLTPSAGFIASSVECSKTVNGSTTCSSPSCNDPAQFNVIQVQQGMATGGAYARVDLKENAVNVTMKASVWSTTASGFLAETRVRACAHECSHQSGSRSNAVMNASLEFDVPDPRFVLARPGFEYATAYVEVEQHIYAIEPHSDSVLSFQVQEPCRNSSSGRVRVACVGGAR